MVDAEETVSVEVDREAVAAYIRLSEGRVARTVELTDDMVVGVELLDLGTSIPLDDLATRFHLHPAALGPLMQAIRWQPRSRVLVRCGHLADGPFSTLRTTSLSSASSG